jgi:hypothetical protein
MDAKSPSSKSQGLTWRDRLLLINGVLFCVLGLAFLVRYLLGQITIAGMVLGLALVGYGGHRLFLAARELRKRAG